MSGKSRYLAILVVFLGIVSLAVGIAFVAQGQAKANYMKNAMREEQITLGLSESEIAEGNVVDSSGEALKAADTVREHRHTEGASIRPIPPI